MIRVLCAILLVFLCVFAASAQDKPARPKAADAAKIRDTKDAMRKLAGELTAAKSLLQGYPEKLDELVKNQLIETVPKDGWGRDFIYSRSKETGYELISLGADGQKGGAGADADITFTEQGLKQELTEEQKAALASKREALRVIGRKVLALFEMKVLGTLVVNYRKDKGSWPEKLSALKPKGETVQDKATARCFDDSWNREYLLKLLPNDNFAIVCYGADGIEGGEDANADFVITERDVRGERNNDEYEYRGSYYNNDWRVDDLAEGVRQFKKSNSKLPAELTDLTQGARRIRNDIPKDRFGGDYVYLVAGDDEFYVVALGSDHDAGGIGDGQDSISPRPGQVPSEREEFVQPEEVKPEDTEENRMLALVAEAQMQDMMRAAAAYQAEKKAWPASLDDIKDRLPGKVVPNDPWESAYEFEQVKTKDEVTGIRVICRGCDKVEGGNKAASDFAINDKSERQELAAATVPPAEGEKPAEEKAAPAGGRFR
ncbi:MAG: type II secretion system protein GspG [Planctomycetes bacterium]|nr:type II secretion system protein GspG [Planctomycetota bacterium]